MNNLVAERLAELIKESKSVMIIGIVGKAEAGKTTLANFMVEHAKSNLLFCHVEKLAFGDGLKEALDRAGICKMRDMFGKKTKFSRWIMQRVGTELVRKQIDPDYWTKILVKKMVNIMRSNKRVLVVVDDIRFLNEADIIRQCGGALIRTIRPKPKKSWFCRLFDKNEVEKHISETEQDGIVVDYDIGNNRSKTVLRNRGIELLGEIYPMFRKIYPMEK